MPNHITFDTKVGRFVFNGDVLLSHAKLVRDAAMAFVMSKHGRKVEPKDVYAVVLGCQGSYSQTEFEFIPSTERR